ncbi:protein FAM177A1 isoform X2 [Anoplophora glabripennis]|uniref:protein FAM177A1 isoform X2 n=1 Tax=Anoplophora glabripennis TaxID=217634 RepID=UPI0008748A2F|nr:protein FAM177A1 isoform X2 [Anoplophora glabripennis]
MVLVRPETHEGATEENEQEAAVKVKTPKRILHFCDGTLEEYSSDEDEVDTPKDQTVVDPSTLTWGPWFWYKAWAAGTSTLSVVDTVGEFLASLFGITTPRYYFELEEYKRRQEEEKKQKDAAQGWSDPSAAATTVSVPLKEILSNQPRPVEV